MSTRTLTIAFAGDTKGLDRASADGQGQLKSWGQRFDDFSKKAGTALIGAGAAAEGFARSQSESNAALRRVAVSTGESEASLRSLAKGMSDHTFLARDAAAGMEELTQRGHGTREEFERILPRVDALADATGRDLTDSLDTAGRLLQPFGQDLNDVGANADQMTRIMTQTDIPLSTLERNLGRIPDELQALDFGLNEAAAGIEVFRDRGFSGQEAVREFRRAVADSEGDMQALLENLGLTADEWARYEQAAAPVPGLTDEMADANNSTMTTMEKLQANVENLMFEYGGLADAAGVAAPALIATGTAMRGATTAGRALNTVLRGNPILLVVTVLAALAAALVVAYKNSETFRRIVQGAFRAVQTAAGWVVSAVSNVLSWFRRLGSGISSVMGGIAGVITRPFRAAFDSVRNFWNSTIGRFSISVPSWVPVIGGRGFSFPRMHSGGVFMPPDGRSEGFALLRRGERVRTPGQAAGDGEVHVTVQLSQRAIEGIAEVVVRRGNRETRRKVLAGPEVPG